MTDTVTISAEEYQTLLAASAGLSQSFVAQMEGGERTGDVATVATLARLLRVRMEDLVADPTAYASG